MATKLKSYSTTPGSNNAAPPNGFPEGMLPSTVNDAAREMMARLAEWYQDAEWILRNDTITGFTGSTIIITGDVTAKYTANRAIRLDENASRVGIITGAVFAAGSTTVTITGYTILALPTSIELGIIDSTKVGLVQISGAQTVTGDKTFSGTLAMSAKPINTAVRVDVASAATLNLDTAASNHVNITGTTTITSVTLTDGRWRNCRCDAALPITTGASLIINGIASGTTITFAAGDTFEAWGEPSGVVRIVSITRVGGGADGLLSTTTVSGGASADISLPSGYRHYRVLYDASVATDGAEIVLRIGTGAPPTYQSGASDYEYAYSFVQSNGTPGDAGSIADTGINVAVNVGSGAAEGADGEVTIYNPANASRYKTVTFHAAIWDNTATPLLTRLSGAGSYNTATTAITGLQFLASAGNITGTFKLYGYA